MDTETKREAVDKVDKDDKMGQRKGVAPEKGKATLTTVLVGKKATMSYALAVATQFNQGAREITIKARGRMISKAVDVAEVVRHKLFKEIGVGDIEISTENVESREGTPLRVSAIEIRLTR